MDSGLPYGQEEQFAKDVKEILPILNRIDTVLKTNHQILVDQRFRMEANQMIMNRQNADIAKNKEVLEHRVKEMEEIEKLSLEKRKTIERGITERLAEINHRDLLSKQKFDEAQRFLFETKANGKHKVAA